MGAGMVPQAQSYGKNQVEAQMYESGIAEAGRLATGDVLLDGYGAAGNGLLQRSEPVGGNEAVQGTSDQIQAKLAADGVETNPGPSEGNGGAVALEEQGFSPQPAASPAGSTEAPSDPLVAQGLGQDEERRKRKAPVASDEASGRNRIPPLPIGRAVPGQPILRPADGAAGGEAGQGSLALQAPLATAGDRSPGSQF